MQHTGPSTSGGPIAIRGYLVQTLVALLEITQSDPPFTHITLEPDHEHEKFDFTWKSARGTHAVQVKSTTNEFKKPVVEAWANELEQVRKTESCRLILVGTAHTSLEGIHKIGSVLIEKKNLDINGLRNEAAHLISRFMHAQGLDQATPPQQEMIADSLVTNLLNLSTASATFTREALTKQLTTWIQHAPRQALRIDLSQFDLFEYAPEHLIGRETETQLLSDAWTKAVANEPGRPRVLTIVALGGEGKTSLVTKWAIDLAANNWPGCESIFAWTFYSQGTREQIAANSDLFLKEALIFFGDAEMAASPQHATDKARRLAQLVGASRTLLILDGLEPLQYPPGPPMDGKLKDDGIATLLKALAAFSRGLCIVTTRYSIPDLKAHRLTSAPEHKLIRLSTPAGVALLQSLGVRKQSASQAEFEKLVEDVKGHALTLNLLGTFLRDAHEGDLRRRDLVKLEEADAEEQGGHAFRVMDAYVESFETRGKTPAEQQKGQRAIALLRLLGLFDRPASADCIAAIFKPPAIPGLTESLIGMSEADRNLALACLETAKLLTVNRDSAHIFTGLDAHPLIREYFATRLRENQPESWQGAHRRLYEHLCATTTDQKPKPTLEDLQPLYQAVAHGCKAGLGSYAYASVYDKRIQRGKQHYPLKELGAVSTDLSCISTFFSGSWETLSDGVSTNVAAQVLDSASESLHSLGRLFEARQAITALCSLAALHKRSADLINARLLLSEVSVSLGQLGEATRHAGEAMASASMSRRPFQRIMGHVAQGTALHQQGNFESAFEAFRLAEKTQQGRGRTQTPLQSLQGCSYCDLLIDIADRLPQRDDKRRELSAVKPRIDVCLAASANPPNPLVHGFALLLMARIICAESDLNQLPYTKHSSAMVDQGVEELRRSGNTRFVSRGLLTRAWYYALAGNTPAAQADLDEAHEIAARGPMPLHLADIHLHRARLFFRATTYPWADNYTDTPRTPAADLAEARRLIEKHGYWRRKEELEDAERAILGTTS